MIVRLLVGGTALALLASCGDDLESRQAAVQDRVPEEEGITIQQGQSAGNRASTGSGPTQPSQGFADDDVIASDDFGPVDDTPSESFVDDAQGFSTAPMDDTSGFDPSPDGAPQGFAPEPLEPEPIDE